MNNQEKLRMQRLSGLIKESYEGEFIYDSEPENLDEAWAGLANIFSRGTATAGQKVGDMAQAAAGKIAQAGQKVGQAVEKVGQKASEWYKEGEIGAVQKKVGDIKNNFTKLKADFEELTGQKLTGNMLQQINQIMAYKKA